MTSFVQNRQLTIALTGEIDHHRAKGIMENIANKIDEFLPKLCVLDFRDVGFMDSSGIAVVIHTLRRVREMEGTLQIRNVPEQPYKVLKAAGIDKITNLERE